MDHLNIFLIREWGHRLKALKEMQMIYHLRAIMGNTLM